MDKIYEYIRRDMAFSHAITLLSWDLETEAPVKAIDGISNTMEVLTQLQYENFVNDEFKKMLYDLDEDKLSEIDKKLVKKLKKDVFEKMSKIPKDEYAKYSSLVTKATQKWEIAKNKEDYSLFKDYLQDLIDTNKKFILYRGYKKNPYDVLLDDYETNLTVEKADKFFDLIRKELIPFIKEIRSKDTSKLEDIKKRFYSVKFSIEEQREISKILSNIMGFDYDKGVIKESEHPFTTNMNNKDVRITTHYYLDDVLSSIYSTVHETGHAIYEQQVDDKYNDTGILSGGSTMGIHESQSRIYENVIGKMKEFTDLIYSLLEKYRKLNISKDEFYLLVNEVKNQYYRTEADEVTYPIHVMIRYEIEKYIFSNIDTKINASDLEKMWNDLYEEYLGIRPENAKEGILQDSHWAGGAFGYFPSYAIASAYASQIYHALEKKVDVKKAIEDKDFKKINDFLREGIHQYGNSKTPEELIKLCTGEEFNPEYYIKYLKSKYERIYK